ncbi:MAG TPA: sulfate transporter CysZ [Marinobacterium sp.]|nr:sulfate transporter CysZ [Marinobacterium sp.]
MNGNNPVAGSAYLLRGLAYLPTPGIRSFVIIPLMINLVLFATAIYLLFSNFSAWVQFLIDLWLPDWDWLSFLEYLLWPLLAVLVVIGVYYGFSVVANFIAAPFNGILAEKVEQQLRGQVNSNLDSWQSALKVIPQSLGRELSKLAYYLPRLLLLFVLSFIPILNLAMPFIWFAFGAWMMAIQYCDYPMDNNRVSFKQMKLLLAQRRWSSLGFGSLVQMGMLVPLLNLLLMPAAVIGATIFWVEQYRD